jgi:hypothetical protein
VVNEWIGACDGRVGGCNDGLDTSKEPVGGLYAGGGFIVLVMTGGEGC